MPAPVRFLLKDGRPHPELACDECGHPIHYEKQDRRWKCGNDKCRWTSEEV